MCGRYAAGIAIRDIERRAGVVRTRDAPPDVVGERNSIGGSRGVDQPVECIVFVPDLRAIRIRVIRGISDSVIADRHVLPVGEVNPG